MLRFLFAVSLLSLGLSTPGLAQTNTTVPSTTPEVDMDSPDYSRNPIPSTAEKYTVPGTGGLLWGSGQNSLADPRSMGGSIGVTIPPQPPTRTSESCNGRPGPCYPPTPEPSELFAPKPGGVRIDVRSTSHTEDLSDIRKRVLELRKSGP